MMMMMSCASFNSGLNNLSNSNLWNNSTSLFDYLSSRFAQIIRTSNFHLLCARLNYLRSMSMFSANRNVLMSTRNSVSHYIRVRMYFLLNRLGRFGFRVPYYYSWWSYRLMTVGMFFGFNNFNYFGSLLYNFCSSCNMVMMVVLLISRRSFFSILTGTF